LLSGRSIGAAEAFRIGLVTEFADDPESVALSYFDRHLAPKSAASLRFATRAAGMARSNRPLRSLLRSRQYTWLS